MPRILLAALLLIAGSGVARGAEPAPQYLQDLDRSYRSGDWVLQCESSRICRILGVVRQSGNGTGTRAIVVISRGMEAGARYFVRLAFIDGHGFVLPPPGRDARLFSRGSPRMPAPLPLQLGAAEGDADYPLYRVSHAQAWRIVGALRRWPGAVLRDRGMSISRMPRGNLDRLLRRMDELQHPPAGKWAPADERRWFQEYHHVVVRAQPVNGPATPDDVLLACDTQTYVNSSEGWQLDARHRMWIVHCPEGAKIFLQERPASGGDAYGAPVETSVTGRDGRKRPAQDAVFDPATSLLQLQLARNGRWDCGIRLRYGFTRTGSFGVIEDRRMPLCRGIPSAYWLLAWSPTSWRLEEASPSNVGSDPSSPQGVSKP